MIPSYFKIEILVKCRKSSTLGVKGLYNEIEAKKKRISELTTSCNETKEAIQQRIPVVDFEDLSFYIRGSTEKLKPRRKEAHERKLLYMGARLRLSSCYPGKVLYLIFLILLLVRGRNFYWHLVYISACQLISNDIYTSYIIRVGCKCKEDFICLA